MERFLESWNWRAVIGIVLVAAFAPELEASCELRAGAAPARDGAEEELAPGQFKPPEAILELF